MKPISLVAVSEIAFLVFSHTIGMYVLPQGEEVDNILNELLDIVMREDIKNNKEDLLSAVSKTKQREI